MLAMPLVMLINLALGQYAAAAVAAATVAVVYLFAELGARLIVARRR